MQTFALLAILAVSMAAPFMSGPFQGTDEDEAGDSFTWPVAPEENIEPTAADESEA